MRRPPSSPALTRGGSERTASQKTLNRSAGSLVEQRDESVRRARSLASQIRIGQDIDGPGVCADAERVVMATVIISGTNFAAYDCLRQRGSSAVARFEQLLQEDVTNALQPASPQVCLSVSAGPVRAVHMEYVDGDPRSPTMRSAEWPLRVDLTISGLSDDSTAVALSNTLDHYIVGSNALRGAFVFAEGALPVIFARTGAQIAVDATASTVRAFGIDSDLATPRAMPSHAVRQQHVDIDAVSEAPTTSSAQAVRTKAEDMLPTRRPAAVLDTPQTQVHAVLAFLHARPGLLLADVALRRQIIDVVVSDLGNAVGVQGDGWDVSNVAVRPTAGGLAVEVLCNTRGGSFREREARAHSTASVLAAYCRGKSSFDGLAHWHADKFGELGCQFDPSASSVNGEQLAAVKTPHRRSPASATPPASRRESAAIVDIGDVAPARHEPPVSTHETVAGVGPQVPALNRNPRPLTRNAVVVKLAFTTPTFAYQRFADSRPAMLEHAVHSDIMAVVARFSHGALRVSYADGRAVVPTADPRWLSVIAEFEATPEDALHAQRELQQHFDTPGAMPSLKQFAGLSRDEWLIPEGHHTVDVLHAGRLDQAGTDESRAMQRSETDPAEVALRIILPEIDGEEFEEVSDQDERFSAAAHKAAFRDVFDACASGSFNRSRDVSVRLFASRSSGARASRTDLVVDARIQVPVSKRNDLLKALTRHLQTDDALLKLKLFCVRNMDNVDMARGVDPTLTLIDGRPLTSL